MKVITSQRKMALSKFVRKQSSSNVWRGIKLGVGLLQKGLKAKIHNGRNWLGNFPILDAALCEIPLHKSYDRIQDYRISGRGWKWALLENLLSTQVLNQMAPVLVREGGVQSDNFWWGLSSTGIFTVKSAYTLAAEGQTDTIPTDRWSVIWKMKVPKKIRTFLWLTHHGKLMTNHERWKSWTDSKTGLQLLPMSDRRFELCVQEVYKGKTIMAKNYE